MAKATISSQVNVAGLFFNSVLNKTDEGAISQELNVTKAQAGTLTTRTSQTAGEVTLTSGHGINTGDIVDLYWEGGSRRGVTVGTVSGNVVPVSGGLGDSLPAQDSDIKVAPVTEANIDFNAEEMTLIAAMSTGAGQLVFLDNSNNELHNLNLSANYAWNWSEGQGFDNPLQNNSSSVTTIGKIRISTSEVDADKNFKMGLLYNSLI